MPETPQLHVQCNANIGSLRIEAGFTTTHPWTVLFGPSGSGKSSLLRLIAGLWQPRESLVVVGANKVTHTPPHQRTIALVAQEPALFPHMDARHNVLYAMTTQHALRQYRGNLYDQADQLLHLLNVWHVATQMPRELSGGEIKRVAIARAIASHPRLLLLDEVFTGMNASLSSQLRDELRTWQRETGTPILSVTHDLPEALEADEVIRIEAGRNIAQGSPNVLLSEEKAAMLASLSQR